MQPNRLLCYRSVNHAYELDFYRVVQVVFPRVGDCDRLFAGLSPLECGVNLSGLHSDHRWEQDADLHGLADLHAGSVHYMEGGIVDSHFCISVDRSPLVHWLAAVSEVPPLVDNLALGDLSRRAEADIQRW